jgi:hypothetical protein
MMSESGKEKANYRRAKITSLTAIYNINYRDVFNDIIDFLKLYNKIPCCIFVDKIKMLMMLSMFKVGCDDDNLQ